MQFLTTIALLTSVASAAYNPCPNGKGKPVCCTLDVAAGIDVLCIPRTLARSLVETALFTIKSLKNFQNQCSKSVTGRTAQCCTVSEIGVAALGCSDPAPDTPPPPAYVPCKGQDVPWCCYTSLSGSVFCTDKPVTPNPASYPDFKATCAKDKKYNKPFCCQNSDGEPILCGIAKDPSTPPPPPAYTPCPGTTSPDAYCCKRDILDNITCEDGTIMPTSYPDFKTKCDAFNNGDRPYCCKNSDGEPILCGIASDPANPN